MKKVILIFEGINYPQTAIDFATRLNTLSPINLTGLFVPHFEVSTVWSYGVSDSAHDFIPMVSATEAALIHNNVKAFSEYCERKKIPFTIDKEFNDLGLNSARLRSRFADLVIIGSGTLNGSDTGFAPDDLSRLLHQIECPVVIIPDSVQFPTRLVLAYDGSESALFAIKQFAYLFGELTSLPTLIAHIGEDSSIPGEDEIISLAKAHFKNFEIVNLEFEESFFSMWARELKGSMVICGAFGRSGLSNLFRKSFMTTILSDRSIPVFVAHK